MQSFFQHAYCSGVVISSNDQNRDLLIRGTVNESVKDNLIYYVAAAPPDYRATFTGSGLPFANPVQAFDTTPNVGSLTLNNNKFELSIMYPNAYYTDLGTVYNPPTLYVYYINRQGQQRTIDIQLSEGIPFRKLTYPNGRTSASFYNMDLPVRSQEEILRDSAYPATNKEPENFWGLRPPL